VSANEEWGPLTALICNDDGTWTYDESTRIEHARSTDVVVHTDRNRMCGVG
jgi:hypothetical protein